MDEHEFQDLFRIWWDDLCVLVSLVSAAAMYFVFDTVIDAILAVVAVACGIAVCWLADIRTGLNCSEFRSLLNLVGPSVFLAMIVAFIQLHYFLCWCKMDKRISTAIVDDVTRLFQ